MKSDPFSLVMFLISGLFIGLSLTPIIFRYPVLCGVAMGIAITLSALTKPLEVLALVTGYLAIVAVVSGSGEQIVLHLFGMGIGMAFLVVGTGLLLVFLASYLAWAVGTSDPDIEMPGIPG
jgi:hypothetical protein